MPRPEHTSITAWTATVPNLDKLCKRLADDRSLPRGKKVSRAEAIDCAIRVALASMKESEQ